MRHAGHRLLARAVDRRHHNHVRRRQRLSQRVAVQRGPRIEVRLKHRHHAPARERLPRRGQRRGDLGWVVRVIVHYRHPTGLAQPLEPPPDAFERRQRRRARGHIRIQRVQHREGRGRVAHVVEPGHREPQLHRPPARKLYDGLRIVRRLRDVADPDIGVGPEPHAPHRRSEPLRHASRTRIVPAHDHAPRAAREFRERCLERRERAVALEVVGFHIAHHGHGRRQRQEGAVELIGLDDEQVPAADPRIPMPTSDAAAGESRGVSPGGRQRLRDHHRGGRLAVRSRDRHEGPAGYELSECVGAAYDRDARSPRPLQFGVLRSHGSRDDDRPGSSHMARIVSPQQRNPQGCQIGGT